MSSPRTTSPRRRSWCCARRCGIRRRSRSASSPCSGREYIVSLKPCGRGILLETLRYSDEVVKAQGYFRDIPDAKPDPEMLDLAEALIERKTAKFDPSKFHDRYVDALRELIERKRKSKGARIEAEEDDETPRRGSNVVDLMAALKKSIERPGAKPDGGEEDRRQGRRRRRRKPRRANGHDERTLPRPPCRRRRWGGGPHEVRWRGKRRR